MSSRTVRLFVVAVAIALTLLPVAAGAGQCSASVSPSPGWIGAVITFTGSGLEPGVEYQINIGGGPIINLLASPTGTFSYQYTIPAEWYPGQTSVGVTDWYVGVKSGCKPMDEAAQPYTVLASQPTTTTTTTTATTVATTTTTTTASTTTVANTTTTARD
ncbi:MAG TPA: hypothetical protein VJA44_03650, partial [Acidimicrobiia bacterium]|nr:hypothetical protein [Acidimicrobiia bacterium]